MPQAALRVIAPMASGSECSHAIGSQHSASRMYAMNERAAKPPVRAPGNQRSGDRPQREAAEGDAHDLVAGPELVLQERDHGDEAKDPDRVHGR